MPHHVEEFGMPIRFRTTSGLYGTAVLLAGLVSCSKEQPAPPAVAHAPLPAVVATPVVTGTNAATPEVISVAASGAEPAKKCASERVRSTLKRAAEDKLLDIERVPDVFAEAQISASPF